MDFLIVSAPISKLVHSWLFLIHLNIIIEKLNTDIKVQQFFFNRSSTMLNNVFKVCNSMQLWCRPIGIHVSALDF